MKTEFKPRSSNYLKKVTESFNNQKFMGFINAKLIEVKPGFCEIHLPFNENLTQQHGFFHAGVIGAIADNAAGYAALSLMEDTSSILTVEFKLNLLVPAKGDLLIVKGAVLKNGKTLTICRSEVYIVNEGIEKLCAASQTTLIELKEK